ncbi:MAG: GNAT family N-acetyltransferase [Kiritimatiellia bacterium]
MRISGVETPPQLQMVWPTRRSDLPVLPSLPDGYVLRAFRPGEEERHALLMVQAGFVEWTAARLPDVLKKLLPGGFLVIEHVPSGQLVSTAMATHNPSDLHPLGGELGWVAGDPRHRRKGLGITVCAAATRCFLESGYRDIYLRTDDWRLPAIKMYLKLGFVPFFFGAGIEPRWRSVYAKLEMPWDPSIAQMAR